jgi:hypothetical protein
MTAFLLGNTQIDIRQTGREMRQTHREVGTFR